MTRVLLMKPSSLGDIVHSLPLATALSHRGMDVHFAARREYRELLELCPAISKILDFPSRVTDAFPFLKILRHQEYDSVIDLQGLFRSAVATACARTARRIGLPDSREGSIFFYDETVTYPDGIQHAIDRYLSVLNKMESPNAPERPDQNQIDYGIQIPPAALAEAERLCGPPGYIVFSPLTRNPEKLWRPEYWEKLAGLLKNERVVLIGRGSTPEAKYDGGPWTNLIDKTFLPVLCAVISKARACVSVDSAPMHLAAALEVPVSALFGPTDPEKVGPYTRRRIVLREQSRQPADISVERVLTSVQSLLRNTK